jgi:hypothetical protein
VSESKKDETKKMVASEEVKDRSYCSTLSVRQPFFQTTKGFVPFHDDEDRVKLEMLVQE